MASHCLPRASWACRRPTATTASFGFSSFRAGAAMRCPEGPLWLAARVGSWLASLAAFSLWPGIDLWVSGLFHTPEEGFWLARSPVANALRSAVWHCSQAMVGLAAVALGLAAARRPVSGFGARPAVFVLALYMFGPGLVVDFGLKDHWGRARPATVAEFGGGQEFTPAFLPADQCDRNCSFVSGEGAAATALALSMAVAAPAVRAAVPVALYRLFL